MELGSVFDINCVEEIIPYIGYVISKYNLFDGQALWIYKSGEKDIFDSCFKFSHKYLEYLKLQKIILVSDFLDISPIDLPEYFECEKCSKEEIEKIINWYALCHPYNNILVISLRYPIGRNGYEWIEKFAMTRDEACKSGILRMRIEE